jgi:hypothetical protein
MGKSFLIKHVVEQATAKLNCRVIVHDLEAVARRQVTRPILCNQLCNVTLYKSMYFAGLQLYTVHTVSSSIFYSVHHISRHFVCSSSWCQCSGASYAHPITATMLMLVQTVYICTYACIYIIYIFEHIYTDMCHTVDCTLCAVTVLWYLPTQRLFAWLYTRTCKLMYTYICTHRHVPYSGLSGLFSGLLDLDSCGTRVTTIRAKLQRHLRAAYGEDAAAIQVYTHIYCILFIYYHT